MNRALCNTCRNVVPAHKEERDGRMYLIKSCPDHGLTETLISSDAASYKAKRDLDERTEKQVCLLNCMECDHQLSPTLLFLDVTNRCNMNCPICINNTPSMKFLFEPPKEYFEKIFQHFSTYNPRPGIQWFGGEPTVREDLIELIKLADSYGLRSRVVTNGLKLADEDYCRRLCKTRARIMFAFDGLNPKMYEDLRNSRKSLELKLKGLENVRKYARKKTILMTLVAKGYNDNEIHDLLAFCHDRRDFIRATYLMPLAHTWKDGEWDYQAPRITLEEVEAIVARAFPGEPIQFLPAGITEQLRTIYRCLGIEAFPFRGAHPNCESMLMLVSDGRQYVPFSRFLKTSPIEAMRALLEEEKALTRRVQRFEASAWGRLLEKIGLKRTGLALMGARAVFKVLRKHLKMGLVFKGKSLPAKVYHALMLPISLWFRHGDKFEILARHSALQTPFNIIILPFEDPYNIETERMERCPASFGFVDPATGQVHTCPLCSWQLFKTEKMRQITEHFGTARQTA
ncbi:MAG: radical SAM protein [Candidatus Sumerlaeia bacterium]|nr:radical SAM protein [Candidatus Sumerlaeia bacterium]